MVTGEDPYAQKNIEQLNEPYLRPDFQKIIKQ